MKKYMFALLTAGLMLGVSVLQSFAAEPTVIRIAHGWQAGASPEADAALAILNKLQADHPEYKFVSEVVVGDEMRNKIRVDVAANNAPDIWQFWVGGILKDYASAGVLLDVNKYLAVSKVIKKSDMAASSWATTTVDGVVRAVPRNLALGVFMVNKALFKKYNLQYPKTWDQFLAVGKEFRKHDVIPTNIGSKGGNPSHFWYGDLVCQYKEGLDGTTNLSTELNFRNPAFVKAAKYCQQMAEAGMFPNDPLANGDWGPSIALYKQGNVAMCYTFPWMYGDFTPEMIANSEIIPIPRLPDADRDPATFIQGTVNDSYCINSKSFDDPKKRAGIVLAMDAINYDIGLKLAQMGVLVSTNNAVMSKVDLTKVPNKMMVKAVQYDLKNKISGSPMIWQQLPDNKLQFDYQATLDELWTKSITADEFIDKVQASIDEYKNK